MKAIVVHEYGDTSALKYEDLPDPVLPGSGSVLVDVHAAGVNFIDTYFRSGLYKVDAFPHVPGREGAGVVAAVDPDVHDVKVGDRVCFLSPKTYSERVTVKASRVVRMPDEVSFAEGAALLLQGITAHYLAHSSFALGPGKTCLVHAAAGGTGALLVQIAKKLGSRVLATVSSEEKAQVAREAGADEVILYTKEDFVARTREITNGRGVDVVYDGVGKATWEGSLRSAARLGHVVFFGNASGPVPPFDILMLSKLGSLTVCRPTMGDYIVEDDVFRKRVQDLLEGLRSGSLRLRIGHTSPLADAAKAHEYLEGRHSMGKAVLLVKP